MWADTLLEVAARLPDAELSEAAEASSASAAAALYRRATSAYAAVTAAPGGPPRADAAVNAGNALCAWAEVAARLASGGGGGGGNGGGGGGGGPPADPRQLVGQAVGLYRAALAQEEDALVGRGWGGVRGGPRGSVSGRGRAVGALVCRFSPACACFPRLSHRPRQTLSNLADALVQQGELAAGAGDGDAAHAAFSEALAAYEASCSMSDSEAGDDLPSLLHNWGVGLHAVAKAAQVGGGRRAAGGGRRAAGGGRRAAGGGRRAAGGGRRAAGCGLRAWRLRGAGGRLAPLLACLPEQPKPPRLACLNARPPRAHPPPRPPGPPGARRAARAGGAAPAPRAAVQPRRRRARQRAGRRAHGHG
jgi:hypothetical protein